MKKLLLSAVLACAPTVLLAADMSGTWTVNGAFDSMGVKYTVSCAIKDDGGKLAGPCTGDPSGGTLQATGTESGTAVEFAYDTTYQGTPVHLDYKGTVAADGSIAGTIDTGGPQGTFTATIAK